MTVEPENQHTEEDGLHEDGEAEVNLQNSKIQRPPAQLVLWENEKSVWRFLASFIQD